MVQRQRDARILRSLLQELAPPRGVTRTAWRRYVETRLRPKVELVLQDLGQPLEGPTAKPEDLEPVHEAREAKREVREARRRTVTIREALARTIEQASPLIGDSLDERVDYLLASALEARGAISLRGAA